MNTQKYIINIYLDCEQTSFLSKNTTNEYLEKGKKQELSRVNKKASYL